MNLSLLQTYLRPFDHCRILGRAFSAGSCAGELIALTRQGEETCLHLLQYDDTYSERLAEAEAEAWESPLPPPVTRRESMLREGKSAAPRLAVEHAKALRWGEARMEIAGSRYGVMAENDCEGTLLLAAFLQEGWRPRPPLDEAALERCVLTRMEVRGGNLPALAEGAPAALERGDTSETYFAQTPVTLTAGEMDLSLSLAGDGEEHTVYLCRMTVADLWAEYRALFQTRRSREGLTAEELAAIDRSEERLLELLPEVCPEGLGLPMVEYESEEDISLEFWSREALDSPLRPPGSSGLMVMAKPEEKTGPRGLPLRACFLEAPCPLDTRRAEAELFCWHRRVSHPPLIL